jgi:hypothetical protein
MKELVLISHYQNIFIQMKMMKLNIFNRGKEHEDSNIRFNRIIGESFT